MLFLQRRQSPLQNSPYCLVSEFEGEHNMGKPATGRGGVAVESDASAIDGDAVHFRSARLLTPTPPIPSTWTRNHAQARTQMRESEPLATSSSYRRITTNRSLLWVTSSGSRVLHEGVTRGGGGVQYNRLIDVLTVQCNSRAP